MFKFHQNRVNFDQTIGKGRFGTVYAYQKKHNDQDDNKWVVKNMVTRDAKEVIDQIQEVVLGFSCQNPYVLPVKGYFLDFNEQSKIWNIYIKLPRMDKSLTSVITKHKKEKSIIPEDQIIKYAYAITKGLQYLHGRGIAHRDIKPDNILLDDEETTIRIADLGIGQYYGGQSTYNPAQQAGSLFYAAPENLDEPEKLTDKVISKADLWSLGMVIFELCTLGRLGDLEHRKKGAEREAEIKNYLNKVEEKYSKTLLDLIMKLLRFEPDERIGLLQVEEILNENYKESSELKNIKRVAREKNIELGSEAEKRIEKLENELNEKMREIEALKEEHRRIIVEFEESEKIRKKELEEVLELKNKLERELKKGTPKVEPNDQQKAQERDSDPLNAAKKKWGSEFTFECKWNGAIRIGIVNEKIEIKNISTMLNDVVETYGQKDNRKITDLGWSLIGCSKLTDQGVKEIAVQIVQKLLNLRRLSLTFQGCSEITDQGLKELATNIGQSLVNVQSLTLDFKGCVKITDQGVKELATNIGEKLVNLTFLNLDFNGCSKITDEGLKSLAISIGKGLVNLQDLAFSFFECPKLTDQGLKELATQLGQKIVNLKELSLSFYDCSQITDDGLKELGIQIGKRSTTLQNLSLYFYFCSKITDQGLMGLAMQIGQRLTVLQRLCLSFFGCSKLTDQGLEALALRVGQRFDNLKDLSLNFNSCSKITDLGLKELALQIGQRLTNLQNLSLDFPYCIEITDQGLEELATQVKKRLDNLKVLKLNFKDCSKVTDQGLKALPSNFSR